MTQKSADFFFSPYPSAQERRLRAAIEDGLAHGSRSEPHDAEPGKEVTLLFSTNANKDVESVAVYYTTDGTEPIGEMGRAIHGEVVQAEAGEVVRDEKSGLLIQQWRAIVPAQEEGTLVRYRADGWSLDKKRTHWYADSVDPVSIAPKQGRVFAYHVDRWQTPQWWHDAIVYQVFVDRFSAAHDEPTLKKHDEEKITGFFGGTLRGILEKLDYIQALGSNCIWLSPIFESPTHHGYDPSDYYTVAKRYGSNDILKQVIKEAHQRGMRVLLDFVANHTSDQNALFIAARSDANSPSLQWYFFEDGQQAYRSYADVGNMPELMTDNPEVQRYLADVAIHWLEDFGADGLRLDYVPGPSHAFWAFFQSEVKQRFPEAITIGEITAPLKEIADYAGRMDAFMDFPLAGVLRRVFAQRTESLDQLLTYLDKRQLPAHMSTGTLLDNHDMHRFLWLAEGRVERLKLAATCHLTLEGTPIIYYGTEVGLSQYDDAHKENAYARAPMLWGEQQDSALLTYYHQLVALRNNRVALRRGERKRVAVEIVDGSDVDQKQVGAYLRVLDKDALLIVINNNERSVNLRITCDIQLSETSANRDAIEWQALFPQNNEQAIVLDEGKIAIPLAPLSAIILAPQKASRK